MFKRLLSAILFLTVVTLIVTGCRAQNHVSLLMQHDKTVRTEHLVQSVKSDVQSPKYIFMFIGDGMSAVQVNSAQIYMGTNKHNNLRLGTLNFQDFEAVGYQTTHDATSFAPDSASTATALSSGFKTWSGTIGLRPVGNVSGNKAENVDTKNVPKTIAERLKEEKGMKIGIVSTVTINHATPAAYYAHVPSRNSYYDIALQMADSEFDYFGGGTIKQPTGSNKDQKDVYEILKEKGYKIVKTKKDILALNNNSGKVYAVTPVIQDDGAMPYAIDHKEGDLTLADFVKKGIDVLDNDKGFFMMVESGKIDWVGHANDAKTNIVEVLAFADAIQAAIDFAKAHPDETLIIVTGDHETGGMTIGQATTGYDVALEILKHQKMSYVAFDEKLNSIIEKNPDLTFEEIMPVITQAFGLKDEYIDGEGKDSYMTLELSDSEVERLKKAFDATMAEEQSNDEEFYRLYGDYNPLTVTLTHILNNKAGIGWTSYSHTGVPVPVYATGVGAELFNGAYDNTEIYYKLVAVTGLK
ncbi:alkaline phosphatase [Defluviitalea raffinosedens]|jgi:alkaline phosphatase|uniref:Alkaline phosphatase n=1 Tax=Defluviitalea raffinosedens TaxID=1450156 RepID=A0A7C8HDW7_9FIRM|nr:alkaline phosphatase [Defluviitalea raffinosedens]KAE9627476.1 alkaline phosphatase [Defluviitalea raffinosedens]MBM7686364.1 alkaline phosphatase [Defluviitalea raffinosedens]HHW68518.1 alkaline phosphatase [Candidatus Epulonipiscium sp.]